MSSVGTAIFMGVSTAQISSDVSNTSAVAENLARSQMEYVAGLPYLAPSLTYASIVDPVLLDGVLLGITIPSGFSVSAAAQTYPRPAWDVGFTGSIEKIVTTATRSGQTVLVLETLRVGP